MARAEHGALPHAPASDREPAAAVRGAGPGDGRHGPGPGGLHQSDAVRGPRRWFHRARLRVRRPVRLRTGAYGPGLAPARGRRPGEMAPRATAGPGTRRHLTGRAGRKSPEYPLIGKP